MVTKLDNGIESAQLGLIMPDMQLAVIGTRGPWTILCCSICGHRTGWYGTGSAKPFRRIHPCSRRRLRSCALSDKATSCTINTVYIQNRVPTLHTFGQSKAAQQPDVSATHSCKPAP